ncbi:MAG: SprB repeat-containing protein, partial [Flavobacteriales bacterium]|nr:SprB repeat-containing protein [Flavobacteriales bacterium]
MIRHLLKSVKQFSQSLLIPTVLLIYFPAKAQDTYSKDNPIRESWRIQVEGSRAFIENRGQFDNRNGLPDPAILYAVDHGSTQIFFTKVGLSYHFHTKEKNYERKKGSPESKVIYTTDFVYMEWVDANPNVHVIVEGMADEYFSYAFFRNGETVNENFIPGYRKLIYKDLYPNIDLEYVFHPDNGIKYSLLVHPGGDPSMVKMRYSATDEISIIDGNVHLSTIFGDIIDHEVSTSYFDNEHEQIKSRFLLKDKTVSIKVGKYDKSRPIFIDPWVQTPAIPNSNGVWECEVDSVGNVYVIGGDMPMKLLKYSSAGILQWTYNTPWDTANYWLGTLATNRSGESFITSGSLANIQRVGTGGGMDWNAGGGSLDEYWNISFNCDQTKLVIGGTRLSTFPPAGSKGMIFDVDPNSGSVLNDQAVGDLRTYTVFGIPISDIEEVRSMTPSYNSRYYFLTLDTIGTIDEDFSACPNPVNLFAINHTYSLGYKCENYRPPNGNAGIKAIRANEKFVYTQNGTSIDKRSLNDGSVLGSATIPGGLNTTAGGFNQPGNSGIDIDTCGDVYAGSGNAVIKYDENLAQLATSATPYAVFDVAVSYNGDIIICGATGTSASTSRTGYVESINMSSCEPQVLACCNANVCPDGPFCTSDPATNLISSSPGGAWSGPGITDPANGTFDPGAAGVGTWTIAYTLSCGSDSLSITVSACAPLTVCQEPNGDLTVSGGTGPYTWQEEVTIQDCSTCIPPNNCSGFPPGCVQTVTVWQTYATTATASPPGTVPIQVYENPLSPLVITTMSGIPQCSPCNLSSTISGTNETCIGNDGSATVTTVGGASPYSYNWNTSPAQTSQIATGIPSGTYAVTITDAIGCMDTATIVINAAIPITVSTSANNALCNASCDGSSTATSTDGTAPYSYQWDSGAGNQTSQTATGLCAGAYSITITDANGCTAIGSVVINEPAALSIVMDSTTVSCNGASDGSASATPGGGASPYQYNWSGGQLTSAATGLSAGVYVVTITDNNNCTQSASVLVTEPVGMGPSISTIDENCGAADGSATVTLSGGTAPFTYLWSNGQTTSTDTGLVAGVYSVTITDASGCGESVSTFINSLGGPTLTSSFTDISCNGADNGTATVNATGGAPPYTYTWSDPGSQTNATAIGLGSDTYNVSVTDTSGCTSIWIVTITEPIALSMNLGSTPASCGLPDGSASATVTGGSGSYTYAWSPSGGTSSTEINLIAGTYTLTVTDSNACTIADSIVVVNSGGPSSAISSTTNASCFSVNDGTATVATFGGTAPLTYAWSPSGGNDTTATGLGPGTYTVTVTDAGGCISTASVLISSPPD